MNRWTSKPLSDVCTFSNGLWTGKKEPLAKAGVFRNTNFRPHGVLDAGDIAYLDVEQRQLEKRRLQPGDIVIEKSGGGPKQAVGRVAYFDRTDGIYSFSNFTSTARVRDRSEVDPRYLLRYLDWCYISGITEKMQSHSTGIRNLDFGAYKAIEVPLPQIEEQRRIVAALDKAFAAIAAATANAEKNLQNGKALFAAIVADAFDNERWPSRSLGEIAQVIMGQSPPGSTYNTSGNGVPLINGPDEFGGKDAFAKTVATKFTTQPTKMCHAGDALVCVRGSTTGRMNLAGQDACIGRGVAAVRSNEDQAWINQFLRFNQTAIYQLGSGATFPNVSTGELKRIHVPLPPSEERRNLLDKLEAADDLIQRLTAITDGRLALLRHMKQSLLHSAFSGELTDREHLAA